MENIKIPSTKGAIAVTINRTASSDKKLAILCSGFLDSKDYNHLKILAEDLAAHGYTVARFDATGIWESGQNTDDYTTAQYLQDLQSVLEFMLQQENFTHILLGGHSKGGFAALYHACHDPRISAVLAIMSTIPYNREGNKDTLEKWKGLGYRISKRDVPGQVTTREFSVPYSYVADRLQYDLSSTLKNLHASLIMIAGEEDTIAQATDIEQLFNQAPEPKVFINIPGIGHDYRHNLEQVRLVNDTILEALKSLQYGN